MTSAVRFTRRTLPAELADYGAWPAFDSSQLSTAELALYERRMHGLIAYLNGDPTSSITSSYGLQTSELLRYLNRCVAVMDDGRLAGWTGLAKGFRTGRPIRVKPVCAMPRQSLGGYTGALAALLDLQPDVHAGLDKYLATGIDPDGRKRGRATKLTAHEIFLQLCTASGISRQAWPFCVNRKGRNCIGKYVDDFFSRRHEKIALLQYGEECRQRSKRSGRRPESPAAVAPFEIVEADEHTSDIIFAVGVDTPKGTKYVPCYRMTLIVVVDRFTSYILGWAVVVRRQITTADFLGCMDNAVAGQCLSEEIVRALHVSIGNQADDPEFRAGFVSVFVDNALAHLSDSVGDRVRSETGAAVSWGGIKRPERRAVVERVFGWIEQEVFHQSPSTTGNSPVDTRRNKPESQAVKHKVTLEQLMRDTAAAVARWNLKGTEANYADSPAAQMLEYYAPGSGCLAPLAPARSTLSPPLRIEVSSAPVRGSRAKGRSPCICYASVEYGSPVLAARWDLIGRRVQIHADPYDVSRVRAYTKDGMELGELVPLSSRWRFPHSLEMRRLLKSNIQDGHDDPYVNPTGQALGKLAQQALDACSSAPRSTRAATVVAEEARKGYTAEPLSERKPKRPDTKTLAARVRAGRDIDFTVIAK